MFKKSLKGWGINVRGSQIKRKKDILVGLQDLEILEELQSLSAKELALRAAMQKRIIRVVWGR
jgi:hypothetical protein